MSDNRVDGLLANFDRDEALINAAKDPGVVGEIEIFIGRIAPKLDPFARQLLTVGAAAAGGAAGPAGPFVSFLASLVGNAGLSAAEKFFDGKAAEADKAKA